MTMPLPSAPAPNPALSGPDGEDVLMLDVLPIDDGDELTITFEHVGSDWRQGVWLATEGALELNGVRSSQLVLWQDTAPSTVQVRVVEGDGKLRLYNIWDSGRGISDHESQSATSGMVVEAAADGARRYRCNDIGYDPVFDKLVFTLRVG